MNRLLTVAIVLGLGISLFRTTSGLADEINPINKNLMQIEREAYQTNQRVLLLKAQYERLALTISLDENIPKRPVQVAKPTLTTADKNRKTRALALLIKLNAKERKLISAIEDVKSIIEKTKKRQRVKDIIAKTAGRAEKAERGREQFLSKEDAKALIDARKETAREKIARSRVWLDVLEALVESGYLKNNRLVHVKKPLKKAQKIDHSNLQAIDQYLRTVKTEAQKLLHECWQLSKKSPRQSLDEVLALLNSKEIKTHHDGYTISTKLPGGGKQRTDLIAILSGIKNVRFIVLSSASNLKTSKRASQKTKKDLVAGGISKQKITTRGCGKSTPLTTMQSPSGGGTVILILPLPAVNP